MTIMTKRRTLLRGATAAVAVAATGPAMPALAAGATPLRIGYLRGLASEGHLWTAQHLDAFAAQDLAVEPVQFVTGLEAYQALVGGSLDLVTTGAVISNFPARGQGKAFLINAEEFASAQLWIHPASGIRSVADLKGRQVATTRGTTAHYFLYRALQHAGLDPASDVVIVHQQMANAVTAFIAGAVPAVATWVPFDAAIARSGRGATMLTDASAYPDAHILNGWSARNDVHATQKDVLRRFARAWLAANEALATRPETILPALQAGQLSAFSLAELQHQYDVTRWLPAEGWKQRFDDGSVDRVLDEVTGFNVAVGAFADPLPASTYFDPTLLQDVLAAG